MCGLMCQFISYNRLIVYYHTIEKSHEKMWYHQCQFAMAVVVICP